MGDIPPALRGGRMSNTTTRPDGQEGASAAPGRNDTRGLRGKVLVSGAIKVLQLALGVGASLLLARWLGAAGYGAYSFAMALATVLANPAQLGWPTLLTREVARFHHDSSLQKLRGVLRISALWTLTASAVLMFIGLAIAKWIAANRPGHDESALVIGSLLVPLVAWIGLRAAALKGLDRVLIAQVLDGVLRPAVFLFLVACMFLSARITAGIAMSLQAVALIVSVAVGTWSLRRSLPSGIHEVVADSSDANLWRKCLGPFMFINAAQAVAAQADLLVLGLITDTRTIGIYKIAVMVGTQVGFAAWLVNSVFSAQIVRLHRAGRFQELKGLLRRGMRYVLAAALPIAAGIVLLGRFVIDRLLGPEFQDAYWPMVTVSIGQLLAATAGPVGILLALTGHERDVARVMGMSALLGLLLIFPLAGAFGALGAAISTGATLVLTRLMLRRVVGKRFPELV